MNSKIGAKDLITLGIFTVIYFVIGAALSLLVSIPIMVPFFPAVWALINGTVLYPGESFSVYSKVAPFTAANGYHLAGSYSNGQTVQTYGGGICQVSTTLYNAVLRAELNVTERLNHSMTVHYVPLSADAAISGTDKD